MSKPINTPTTATEITGKNAPKKPSSLPNHWPRSSEAEISARPQRIVKIGTEQDFSFCSNKIKTSKYEWYSFLPLFFLEEFDPNTKIANCYFLVIACLQVVRPISNTNGYPTTLIPLTVVLFIAGIFKGLEDYARHQADRKANSSFANVFNRAAGAFEKRMWSEIEVGDFVKVESRESIPADLVCLQVSEPNVELPKGVCYVETKSLDGETNLKMRNVLPALLGKIISNTDLDNLLGTIEMEHPNNLIDSFSGVVDITGVGKAGIQHNNVILRGCVLRSTDWLVGLVINTGHDVKIMQSGLEGRAKASNLDVQATRQILGVIVLLLLTAFVGATAQAIFNQQIDIDSIDYLDWDENPVEQWFVQFFYNLLLHASKIPVSLYVSMAIIRFTQGYFMNRDLQMYYAPLDAPAIVRTMTLNEELGQISHIFSDKTGTLTCNNMNYRKASINGVAYGQGITEIGRAAWKLLGKDVPADVLFAEEQAALCKVEHVAFFDPKFYLDYGMSAPNAGGGAGGDFDSSQHHTSTAAVAASTAGVAADTTATAAVAVDSQLQQAKIAEFYKYLAVCHEVVPERLDGGKIRLSAPNPDDEALVCAADFFGYSFRDNRDKTRIVYERSTDSVLEIEVLYVIPFTSKRKRMSVVVRDVDGSVKIITKGADSAMFERVDASSSASLLQLKNATAAHIKQYSQEGLRCLVLGSAVIDSSSFAEWSRHYDEANTNPLELEKRKRGEDNDIDTLENYIEQNLQVVGATAIEDRLQEGVPDCIEKMVQAGINVWVLTGDKEETAINIAVACNLVLPNAYMKQVIINKDTAPDMHATRTLLRTELRAHNRYLGIDADHDAAELRSQSLDPQLSDAEAAHRAAIELCAVSTAEGEADATDDDAIGDGDGNYGSDGEEAGGSRNRSNNSSSNRNNNSSSRGGRKSGDKRKWKPRALIVDGPSLIGIMQDDKTRSLLLQFSNICKAVVCCRVSPDQKREVVELVKNNVPGVRTLAVGDGANDVAMIKAAHIGVGIRGEEGVQAVNASDYAIAQFRFLNYLILKHGRYNYIRMSNLVCYIFYKNIFNSFTLFWFNFFCAYSGQKMYTEAAIQFFNLFYTSVPILLYGTYDKDVPAEDVQRFPQLYTPCIHNAYFNTRVFWGWVSNAAAESVLCSVLPFFLLRNFDYRTGNFASFMQAGALCFTCVVLVVNLKMFLFQCEWYWPSVLALLLSVGSWVAVAYIISSYATFDVNSGEDFYQVWNRLLESGVFWLSLLLLVGMIQVKDLAWMSIRRFLLFDERHVLQEMSAWGIDPGVSYARIDSSSVAAEESTRDSSSNSNEQQQQQQQQQEEEQTSSGAATGDAITRQSSPTLRVSNNNSNSNGRRTTSGMSNTAAEVAAAGGDSSNRRVLEGEEVLL